MDYNLFIKSKQKKIIDSGFIPTELNPNLFDFQKYLVKLALEKGRFCLWASTGLGKTLMELEWAHQVNKYTGQRVLILAPLAVGKQTESESKKFGYTNVSYLREDDSNVAIAITNYERLDKFNPNDFIGVVLDESSILKNYVSSTCKSIIDSFSQIPYKLAASATPAPNDYTELGNHCEFMGVMSRVEMLASFFVHDGGSTSEWRIKKHAQSKFWEWTSGWGIIVNHPGDLGFDDSRYDLPRLNYINCPIESDIKLSSDTLFTLHAIDLSDQRKVKRESLGDRVDYIADLVNKSDEQWLVFCELNDESKELNKKITDAIEVKGSDSVEHKESSMIGFANSEIRVLVSKPSICGMGMNFQSCHNIVFASISHSWESFYQSVRRCWRFGQQNQVNVYLVYSTLETPILENLWRKEKEANVMKSKMIEVVKNHYVHKIETENYNPSNNMKFPFFESESNINCIEQSISDDYAIYQGDSCELIKAIPDESIGYSIFSPPFSSLYVFSSSDRDIGNCRDYDDFVTHFEFLISELYRILQPGRLVSIHCMNLPTSKQNDGFIGLKDFRGDIIRSFQNHGFIYHSEVCIWKNPVVAMQRTKALGLLHKQLKKDSSMSRQGIADYLVTMRKPGTSQDAIAGTLSEYHGTETIPQNGTERDSIEIWQRYASPVWMDINQSNTLQYRSARDNNDEKHISPLQLDVIRRGLQLWSNPDDIVFSPFMGIGSEGYVSLEMDRRFIGFELKESYYNCAKTNLQNLINQKQFELKLD